VKAKNGHLLADSHKFSIGGRTISLSYWMYMELVILCR
jgi:hypothetical protein